MRKASVGIELSTGERVKVIVQAAVRREPFLQRWLIVRVVVTYQNSMLRRKLRASATLYECQVAGEVEERWFAEEYLFRFLRWAQELLTGQFSIAKFLAEFSVPLVETDDERALIRLRQAGEAATALLLFLRPARQWDEEQKRVFAEVLPTLPRNRTTYLAEFLVSAELKAGAAGYK